MSKRFLGATIFSSTLMWRYIDIGHIWLGNCDQDIGGGFHHNLDQDFITALVTILLSQLGDIWKESIGDHRQGRNASSDPMIDSSISGSADHMISIFSGSCDQYFLMEVFLPGRDITERWMFLCKKQHSSSTQRCIISNFLFTFCFWSPAALGVSPWCSSARCRCSSSSAGSPPAGLSAPSSSEKIASMKTVSLANRQKEKLGWHSRKQGKYIIYIIYEDNSECRHHRILFWGTPDMLVNIIETNRKIC